MAKVNFDHFADVCNDSNPHPKSLHVAGPLAGTHPANNGDGGAWLTYQTGHELAMSIAAKAGALYNNDMLIKAYCYDAFACHYLSDLFASGHMRTPREALYYGTGSKIGTLLWTNNLGSALVKLMHDEDNRVGLNVENYSSKIGGNSFVPPKTWRAYGDKYLATGQNNENLNMQQIALQLAIDEVWESFKQKKSVVSTVYEHIPFVTENNHLPMFTYDKKINLLLQRNAHGNGYESIKSELSTYNRQSGKKEIHDIADMPVIDDTPQL